MIKPKLLYYNILNFQPSVLKLMQDNFEIITLLDPGHDTDDILQSIDVSLAPLGFKFDKNKIDHCHNLKVIASSTLSTPHIDVEYSKLKGIKVCHLGNEKQMLESITPTAELTWGLIISITRRIPWAHKAACAGQWGGRPFGQKTPRMLSNMTLGIVGLGRLGSIVASYGKAFDMEVYYYSPNSIDSNYERCSTLLELAQCSDIVSIHAHHTPETDNLISTEFFAAMKPGSFLVNTARGSIIDQASLLGALESGHLGGAALDVLAEEYLSDFKYSLEELPLIKYSRTHDNLIITPHYAGATVNAWIKTQTKTFELIIEAIT